MSVRDAGSTPAASTNFTAVLRFSRGRPGPRSFSTRRLLFPTSVREPPTQRWTMARIKNHPNHPRNPRSKIANRRLRIPFGGPWPSGLGSRFDFHYDFCLTLNRSTALPCTSGLSRVSLQRLANRPPPNLQRARQRSRPCECRSDRVSGSLRSTTTAVLPVRLANFTTPPSGSRFPPPPGLGRPQFGPSTINSQPSTPPKRLWPAGERPQTRRQMDRTLRGMAGGRWVFEKAVRRR